MIDEFRLHHSDKPFGDIYIYLIDSLGIFTKENFRAYKSLEAYNYFCVIYVAITWEGEICLIMMYARAQWYAAPEGECGHIRQIPTIRYVASYFI